MKKICVVCGKEFESKGRTTCSEECRQLARKKSMAIVYENKKKQNPNTYKAGKYTRTCIVCGETFRTNSKTREVCYIPHTRTCCICGKEFPLNVYSSKTLTCSRCASDLRVQRNMEKYGVRSNFQLESNKEKIKQTCLERYGVENPMQSEEVKEKLKASNQEKYGVDWVVQAEEVKAKSKATNLERYGVEYGSVSEQANEKRKKTNQERYDVDYVFQSREFQENAKQSNLERYGTEYYTQSSDFREKATKTWIEHYGVDNPLKSSEIQHRVEITSMEKYGTHRPQQSNIVKSKIIGTQIQTRANSIEDEFTKNEYLQFKANPKQYLENFISVHPDTSAMAISNHLGFKCDGMIRELLYEFGFNDLVTNLSSMESCIVDFIQSIDPSIVIEIHNRKVISPKEIDIYLPEYRIGFECNPTATHNSTISLGQYFGDETSKPISWKYHQEKSIDCQRKGVFLFHIFGYEWKYKQEIIKSMIRNILKCNSIRYYGRDLVVLSVSYQDTLKFLSENHRQGIASSKINLGLYTIDKELVSLMTFNPTRASISRSTDDKDAWELLRFCNKLNTTVVGGASKLFKHFIDNYDVSKVVSFSDIAHTRGNLYSILGFDRVRTSDPGYCWVNINTDVYHNRVACQKHNLPKLFNEPDLDIKNQTEKQIMVSHGFVQVFDSGTVRWEYTK